MGVDPEDDRGVYGVITMFMLDALHLNDAIHVV